MAKMYKMSVNLPEKVVEALRGTMQNAKVLR